MAKREGRPRPIVAPLVAPVEGASHLPAPLESLTDCERVQLVGQLHRGGGAWRDGGKGARVGGARGG